jgi:hypothetical protein
VETAFLDWLKEFHAGKENAIHARYMRQWGDARTIRFIVHDLRLQGVPVCSGQEGYYYAKRSHELSQCLSFLESMEDDLRKVIEAQKDTYYEMKHEERMREIRA